MNNVTGVIFKEKGKIYFFKGNDLLIKDNDFVVVETEKGLQIAKVVISNILNKEILDDMKSIIRIATKKDMKNYYQNKKDSYNALKKAKSIVKKRKLNMHLLDCTYTLERNQLIFTFVAENRVDFRELAKELATLYKTRIELRQIGIRDKAKEISGIGQCGRELCCSCFLKEEMDTVTINMAKNQNLALNPTKINGQCGRLLCCLKYENDTYSEFRQSLPNIGEKVKTENGIGIVVGLDIINKTYTVEIEEEGRFIISV